MKPILRDAHLLASGSPLGPQPLDAPATTRTDTPEKAQSPAGSTISPCQAEILRLLAHGGGTGTTAQLGQASGLAPLAVFADAEALAALGLISLQQHPLLPNHATLTLTAVGRRVADTSSDTFTGDGPCTGRSYLSFIPGGRPSIDSA